MSDEFVLDVADGFGAVADAFRENFAEGLEIGAQFSAYRHGEPLVRLVGGSFDRKGTRALRGDDLIAVFSSGKAVAALVVALCVERGELDYDQRVSEVWPEFAAEGKGELTLGEVMSHQAGLCGITSEAWRPVDWLDWSKACAELAGQAPLFPPGSVSGYHPVTYGFLAGEPIRRATGRTLGDMLREDLCEAHGLDIFIGTPPSEHERCAQMRKPDAMADFGEITAETRAAFLTPWASPGGAGVAAWREAELAGSNCHASADSLARFMRLAVDGVLEGREVLSNATLAQFKKSRSYGGDRVLPFTLDYAAGVMRNAPNFNYGPNAGTVGHSGWGGSCVFADGEAGVHAAYAMTRQSNSLMGDPRSLRVIGALYECLAVSD